MANITAADSIYTITIDLIYPTPQALQGYMADAAFASDAVEQAQVVMGVDGRMSHGWVPNPTVQTVSIMPDSPSQGLFENWIQAQQTSRQILVANATIIIPGIGRAYTLTRGVLTQGKIMPDVNRVLAGTPFQITWERVTSAAVI